MEIRLGERTEETVRTYFQKAGTPEIRRVLPQRAKTLEEALDDFRESRKPGAKSYGRTIWAVGRYVGDVWCYCMDPGGTPNAMVSYCVFAPDCRNRGVASRALELFLEEVRETFALKTVGAFTFADNPASIRVLEKNGFRLLEEFEEDGTLSRYYEKTL